MGVCLSPKNQLNSILYSNPTSRILVLPSVILTKSVPYHLNFLNSWELIGGFELNRALTGWTAPGDVFGSGRVFNEDYFTGDVGFDPLGLAPTDEAEFYELHTKELQNGRLAMLGVAGMVAQELVNGKEIFVNAGLSADRFDPASVPVQF